MKGKIGFGIEYTRKAIQVFEEEYSVWDTAYTLIALGTTLPHLGQFEDGLAALLKSIALFRELGDARWLIEASNYAGMFTALFSGSRKEGTQFIDNAIKLTKKPKYAIIYAYLNLTTFFLGLTHCLAIMKEHYQTV